MTNEELRELLAKATPGEWTEQGRVVMAIPEPNHYVFVTPFDSDDECSEIDARLIAAMKNELSRLLDESDQLHRLIDERMGRLR